MDTKVDYYEILGVAPDADVDTIRRAYKAQARKTHPDVGGSAALFRLVSDAHTTLTDPASRARYDAARTSTSTSAGRPPPPSSSDSTGNQTRSDQPSDRRSGRDGRDGQPQWARTSRQPPLQRTRSTWYGTLPDGPAADSYRQALLHAPLPDHTFVFHQVHIVTGTPLTSVLIAGTRLLTLQLVVVPPGVYRWDPVRRSAYAGQRREPAFDADTVRHDTDQLMTVTGWAQAGWEWGRALVVVSATGNPADVDVTGLDHPDFDVVPASDVPAWLRYWWDQGGDGAARGHVRYIDMSVLARLQSWTSNGTDLLNSALPTLGPASVPTGVAPVRQPRFGPAAATWLAGSGGAAAVAAAALLLLPPLALPALWVGSYLTWTKARQAHTQAPRAQGCAPDLLVAAGWPSRPVGWSPTFVTFATMLLVSSVLLLTAGPALLWAVQTFNAGPAPLAALVVLLVAVAAVPVVRYQPPCGWREATVAATDRAYAPLVINALRCYRHTDEVRDVLDVWASDPTNRPFVNACLHSR